MARSASLTAPPPNEPRWRLWAVAAAIVLLTCLAYIPAFTADWQWDDGLLAINNKNVAHVNGLGGIWTGHDEPDYFPLTLTSFWVEYRLWAANRIAYHTMQVIFHVLNALLLWTIFRKLKIPGAALGALLFAIHPLTVETVAWVAEQKNTLSFFFTALALLAFLRRNDRRGNAFYCASILLFALALLCKTTSAAFGFMLLLIIWFQDHRITRADVRRVLPFIMLAIALGIVTVLKQDVANPESIWMRRPLAERVVQSGISLWFYVYKSLLPIHLATVYPELRIVGVTLLDVLPLFAAAGAAIAVYAYRKTTVGRALALGLGIFVLALAPVLGIINMAWLAIAPAADHMAYLALPGITGLVGAAVAVAARRRTQLQRWGIIGVASAAVLICGCLTYAQSTIYRTSLTLWYHNVTTHPTSAKAFQMMGANLMQHGRPDQAVQALLRSVQLDPGIHAAWGLLGEAFARLRDYHDSLLAYQRSDDLGEVGWCEWNLGQRQQGFDHMLHGIRNERDDARTHYHLALAYQQMNQPQKAIEELRKFLYVTPGDVDGHSALGDLYMAQNDFAQAATEYQTANACDPENPRAGIYFNLGIALAMQQRRPEAEAAFGRAIELNPSLKARLAAFMNAAAHPAATRH